MSSNAQETVCIDRKVLKEGLSYLVEAIINIGQVIQTLKDDVQALLLLDALARIVTVAYDIASYMVPKEEGEELH